MVTFQSFAYRLDQAHLAWIWVQLSFSKFQLQYTDQGSPCAGLTYYDKPRWEHGLAGFK